MSVVAWDGRYLAADRQATGSGMRMVCEKLFVAPDFVYAATGDAGHLQALLEWHAAGAKPAEYPEFQKTPDWTRLVVLDRRAKTVVFYEQQPYAIPVRQNRWASGSGRDFAMGAMHAGATSVGAVEITNKCSVECGYGVDVFDVLTGEVSRHDA